MKEIKISSYTNTSSKNYGMNSILVTIGDLDLYFSYQTVVAFSTSKTGLVVRQNVWGPTTGKHLNAISKTALRIDSDTFEKQLEKVLRTHKLIPVVNV